MFNLFKKIKFRNKFKRHFEENFKKNVVDNNYKYIDHYESYDIQNKKISFHINEQLNSEIDYKKFSNVFSEKFNPIEPHMIISKRVDQLETDGKKFENICIESGISRSSLYKIKNGTQIPEKDNLIKLCIGLELGYEESLKLFKTYGLTLSPSIALDFTTLYFLKEWEYELSDRGTTNARSVLQDLLDIAKVNIDLFPNEK